MAAFFGLIVKSGDTQNVDLPEDHILTLTNAAFVGKANETAKLYVSVDRKYVLATLVGGKSDQTTLDLTFFPGKPLSFGLDGHGEIHLVGSMQSYNTEISDSEISNSEDDADAAELAHRAGVPKKPLSGKSALLDIEAEESADELDLDDASDAENDDEFDDEDDDEAKPKPAPAKKDEKKPADAATPSKKDEKKVAAVVGGKPAAQTPKAAGGPESAKKQAGGVDAKATPKAAAAGGQKRPAGTPGEAEGAKKAKPDTPKSGGLKCEQCARMMPNQQALEQHTKAKHAAK